MLSWRCPDCGIGSLRPDRRGLRCASCAAFFECLDGIWQFGPAFRPGGFPAERHDALAAIEEHHFWFGARDHLVLRMLERQLPSSARAVRVLDLGCGSGRVLARLEAAGFEAAGVDGHPEPLSIAARRAPRATIVHADVRDLPFAAHQFDAVLLLDVLEHVEPGPLLREIARVVRPGGGLLVTVPARPGLWSRMDEQAGHRCRYTIGQLTEELDATGWTLQRSTHYQFLLLPLVALTRRLARRREAAIERRPPRWLNSLLGWINRMEVSFLGRVRLPWGSTLVAWGGRSA